MGTGLSCFGGKNLKLDSLYAALAVSRGRPFQFPAGPNEAGQGIDAVTRLV